MTHLTAAVRQPVSADCFKHSHPATILMMVTTLGKEDAQWCGVMYSVITCTHWLAVRHNRAAAAKVLFQISVMMRNRESQKENYLQ